MPLFVKYKDGVPVPVDRVTVVYEDPVRDVGFEMAFGPTEVDGALFSRDARWAKGALPYAEMLDDFDVLPPAPELPVKAEAVEPVPAEPFVTPEAPLSKDDLGAEHAAPQE